MQGGSKNPNQNGTTSFKEVKGKVDAPPNKQTINLTIPGSYLVEKTEKTPDLLMKC